jgi:hypothetical protein
MGVCAESLWLSGSGASIYLILFGSAAGKAKPFRIRQLTDGRAAQWDCILT